jgi:hypothetical protein
MMMLRTGAVALAIGALACGSGEEGDAAHGHAGAAGTSAGLAGSDAGGDGSHAGGGSAGTTTADAGDSGPIDAAGDANAGASGSGSENDASGADAGHGPDGWGPMTYVGIYAGIKEHCAQGSASRDTLDACWTSVTNPTKEHLKQADLHRKHAADHRAASEALRDAEQKSCAGIAPDDRDISPFWHTADIAGVERSSPNGVIVTFRAVPDMTAEWLQRAIDCHLARNAALGHDVPDMPDCPLVPKGVSAQVQSTGKGFAVTLRSNDANSASDLIARAERLQRAQPK